jgi:hypothetical protein
LYDRVVLVLRPIDSDSIKVLEPLGACVGGETDGEIVAVAAAVTARDSRAATLAVTVLDAVHVHVAVATPVAVGIATSVELTL